MRESVRLVGQRLMVGFDGLEATKDLAHLIREFGVGSVILFSRNVAEPEQLADLVREIQSLAEGTGHEQPLLVGIDQEGGRVQRLRAPWTEWPPLRAVGRLGSEELAQRMGAALAAELSACGIGCDFAPVVDVDTNPANPVIGDRSFGEDPDLVGRLGEAFTRGLVEGGVAACAKHFPGHGDTEVDSHLELPRVEHDRSRLDDIELRPFRHLIGCSVPMIMTAHVLMPELDAERPATLSRAVIGGLLREELGYGGVVVSDDLEMKAIAAHWPIGRSAVLAAGAGCDLLLVCHDVDAQVEACEALVRAAESGELAWTELEASASRMARLRQRFAIPGSPDRRRAREAAGAPEARALALDLAERGGVRA